MRRYATLPDIPEAGLLERYMDSLAVIVPVARTNLVTNPSFETDAANWTAVDWNTLNRSTQDRWRGAYALQFGDPNTNTPSLRYGTATPLATTAGVTYAVSIYVTATRRCTVTAAVRNTANTVTLAERTYTVTPGAWQRLVLYATETVTTSRIVVWTWTVDTSVPGWEDLLVYVDAAQVEACGAEGVFASTYIDGDQPGLMPNQFPPAYLWTGTPHASPSQRSAQTRAGGQVMKFRDFGFLLTAIIGLGLAPPQHEALAFAQLDGGQYQTTIKPPRAFSLVGRFVGATPTRRDIGAGQLARLLDRDRVGQRQPLVLTMQAEDCGRAIGEPLTIPALYTGGLEGAAQELPTAAAAISFTAYLPAVLGSQAGGALTPQQTVTNTNGVALRSPAGVWSALETGVSGGGLQVRALARGLDGTIYVGGTFTGAGSSGADYIAAYNPTTGAWSVLGSATALNATVYALAIGPDGDLYVGGAFTNAGGVAAADYIARWDVSASTWNALGTGADFWVLALQFAPDGTLYAGGAFNDMGGTGADFLARWNGSAWSVVSSATALNALVNGLAYGNGQLYVGGAFTNAGGIAAADRIAAWNGSAYAALGTGMDDAVAAIAVGPNGLVYAGGQFNTAGGVAAPNIAVWNGTMWQPLGAGVDDTVWALDLTPDGTLYVAGLFNASGTLALPEGIARWNGAAWIPADIDLPGTPNVWAITALPDGTVIAGYDTSGSATAAALTTVTNRGTAAAYPTLTIRGPSSGTARIYQLVNITTGAAIFFNATINAGETMTLTLDPTNITFTSTFQGNILRTILPGSRTTEFFLQPGDNTISLFAASSTVTAVLTWTTAYASLDDALYQVDP